MLKKIAKIKLRYIFFASIFLIILKIGISATYNYNSEQKINHERANLLVHLLLHTRFTLIYADLAGYKRFKDILAIFHKELKSRPRIKIYMTKTAPYDSTFIAESTKLLSPASIARLQKQLYDDGDLTLATLLKNQNKWLILSLNYPQGHDQTPYYVLMFFSLLIILLLWIGFMFYYRHTLPGEVLNFIKGGKTPKKKTLIANLSKQIQEYYHEKNLMLTALSHDIKTPLTEAMLKLELLEDSDSGTAESIKTNLDNINEIITASLDYSKEPDNVKKVTAELISLIEIICDHYVQNGFDIKFKSRIEQFDAAIEIGLFKRAISNIIDNARKYGEKCRVFAKTQDGKLILDFVDNGPGVPKELQKSLSIPYFRVDQSRSRQTGGTGLGLAIVKKIVDLHGGTLSFKNLAKGGFCVRIVL